MDKVTRQCPQTLLLKRKESRSGIEPRSFRLPAYRLTARPNRFTPNRLCVDGRLCCFMSSDVRVDILRTSCDQCRSMVQYSFTSTETRRLVRTDSTGRPPRLSHSSWTMNFVWNCEPSFHLWFWRLAFRPGMEGSPCECVIHPEVTLAVDRMLKKNCLFYFIFLHFFLCLAHCALGLARDHAPKKHPLLLLKTEN